MKSFTPRSLLFVVAAALLAFTVSASAQTNAYDDALHYDKQTWITNGQSFGFGFTPWVLATNGPSSHGFFDTHDVGTAPAPTIASPTNSSTTGSPPGNDNNQHVWGMFANGTGANMTVAYRGFSNSLSTSVAFKLEWQNDGIGSANTNQGGFVLRNGNSTAAGVADFTTGFRFQFYYIGGGANSFVYWDGNGVSTIGIPFTTAGLECEFTLEPNDTYRFVVKNATNNVILALLDGQPLAGTGGSTIDSVALFAKETSNNQEFNFMQIVSTSLTPPTIVNVQPTNGSIYVSDTTTNVSFEVDSATTTILGNTNNIILQLNGVTQANLLFNTASPTQQLLVTNNTPLAPNTFYNAVIIAVDANSNKTTNSFNFNTFSPNNPCIEAEDYNYGAGQYFPSPTPDQYAGLLGTNGIDYLDVTTLTNLNDYRPDYNPGDPPLPQLLPVPNDATDDPVDHDMYFENGTQDWQLAYTDAGEWQNYTRSFSGTRFTVYARAASAGSGSFQMNLLADATATTTNQPRAALGTCSVPNTGGSKVYSGQLVPLADFFGTPVVLALSGTATLQQAAISSRGYNLNYLMLVPNNTTNLLKPYISVGLPAPGATGVGLDSGISFTIANRQTAVNPATIQVLVNSNNVTGSLVLSNNAAGTAVTYMPSSLLPANSLVPVTVIFNDATGTNSHTNNWSFTTVNQTIATLTNALSVNPGTTSGFSLGVYKIDNTGPEPGSIASALLELNGQVTNSATGFPWTNVINNTFAAASYLETNTLNYDITGTPTGTFTFAYKSPFPDISTTGAQLNFVVQALFYMQLNAGSYHLVVRSDDGFNLTAGPTPASASQVLGQFNGGRANTTPTDMFVTAPTNGFYPMNLLYFQEGSGGSLEFYSISNGVPILINDPTNPGSIKAFAAVTPAVPVTILNPAHSGAITTFSFQTQASHTHFVEYKNALSDPSWTPLQTINGDGSIANVTDNTASGTARFYRVRTL
jgi:hypothetical protein